MVNSGVLPKTNQSVIVRAPHRWPHAGKISCDRERPNQKGRPALVRHDSDAERLRPPCHLQGSTSIQKERCPGLLPRVPTRRKPGSPLASDRARGAAWPATTAAAGAEAATGRTRSTCRSQDHPNLKPHLPTKQLLKTLIPSIGIGG